MASKTILNVEPEQLTLFERLPTGETVGKLPEFLQLKQLDDLGHPKSPIAAIRTKCLDCSAGKPSEVRKCVCISCPLWPLRMGKNPFHGHARNKRKTSSN